jgi:hypothetical protein
LTVLLTAGSLFTISVFGQDSPLSSHDASLTIPNITLLSVQGSTGGTAITFTPPTVTVAGSSLAYTSAVTGPDLWLNYTSIISLDGALRKITVAIDVPIPGVDITVSTAVATLLNSDGTLGTPVVGSITLGTTAANLITGIGSSYTGTGSDNGHQLTYNVSPTADSFELLRAKTSTVSVTYTLTDV